jgi:hypothetical protein
MYCIGKVQFAKLISSTVTVRTLPTNNIVDPILYLEQDPLPNELITSNHNHNTHIEALHESEETAEIVSSSIMSIQHSSTIINSGDRNIFTQTFPDLFPFGRGGFNEERKAPISLQLWIRHLLRLSTGAFRKHPSFALLAFDILNRQQLQTAQSIRCNMNPTLTSSLAKVTEEGLKQYLSIEKSKIDAAAIGHTFNGPANLVRSVEKILQHGWFTDEERTYYRTRLFATSNQLGCPHLFVTLSPDGPNHILLRLWAHQMSENEYLRQSQPVNVLPLNGVGCADFFHQQVSWFLKNMVKLDGTAGVFGTVLAYFGAVESQSTTNLHIHMLIWVKGLPTCNQEWKQALESESRRLEICEYYDSIRSCSFPGNTVDTCYKQNCQGPLYSEPFPEEYFHKGARESMKPWLVRCSLCKCLQPPTQFHVPIANIFMCGPEALAETDANLTAVLKQVQEHDHRHRASCFKKTAVNHDASHCRFQFPTVPDLEPTHFDQEGNIHYRREMGSEYLNGYNKEIALIFKCNHDVKPLPGTGATQASFYSMKYATKKQQKIENAQNVFYKHYLERIQKEKLAQTPLTREAMED